MRLSDAYERNDERQMRHTRLIVTAIHNSQVQDSKHIKQPHELIPLQLDKELSIIKDRTKKRVSAYRTPQQMQALFDFFNQPN